MFFNAVHSKWYGPEYLLPALYINYSRRLALSNEQPGNICGHLKIAFTYTFMSSANVFIF